MSGISDRGPAVSGLSWLKTVRSGKSWGAGPPGSPAFVDHRPTLARRLGVAAFMVAIAVLLLGVFPSDSEAVVQLERLSSRIARAQTLAPEAHEAIDRLIVRQRSLAGTGDPEKEMRRQAAIDRVTNAIQAKYDSATGRTIHRRLLPN